MPLLDEELYRNFVRVDEDESVTEALEKLEAQGGDDAWHILVARGPDRFGVLKVSELGKWLRRIGPMLFDLRFADLRDRLPETPIVRREETSFDAAERMAFKSPSGAVIALEGARVAGIVQISGKELELFPGSTMGQLYGDYITQAPDARAEWQPAGVEPPTCPHCGHQGFYRYRVEDGAFACSACDQVVSEG